MSLILEALKKSEAERLRRQTPGLMTPATKSRRRRVWPWVAMLMLLSVTLFGGWWLGQRNGDQGPDSAALSPSPAILADESRSAQPADAPAPAATRRETPTLDRPAVAERVPYGQRARPQEDRESAALVAPSADDPLLDPDLDDETRARLADALGALPDPPPTLSDAPPQPAQDAPPIPTEAEPAQPDVASTPTADEGPPSIHELPYTLRRDIPEIRISMLVYSGDQASRFALVNGERRIEGDEVAPGVRLVEIGAQTLELEFRGQHFLLRQGSR